MALVMKTIIEDQCNSKSSDAFLPLQEYFYVWLSGAYHDPCVVLSTACSILVALETYGSNCAYASIAGQALEDSADVLCALRFRYLALIHALFVTLHNALKASDSQVLLDPQTVLNQWCARVLVFQSAFWCLYLTTITGLVMPTKGCPILRLVLRAMSITARYFACQSMTESTHMLFRSQLRK